MGVVERRSLAWVMLADMPASRRRQTPKERFQRRRFRDDPDLAWDESWTEAQAAEANGLHRIWDCGRVKWVRPVD